MRGGEGGAVANEAPPSMCFSRLARESYLTVAVGLSTLVTQADALCSPMNSSNGMTNSYHADAFIPLLQAILAGLLAGPARCGAIAANAAALTVAAENPNSSTTLQPLFTDERYTDVAEDCGKYFIHTRLLFTSPC